MRKTLLSLIMILFCISVNAQQKHNGYEYVDLGLSVKWATCNVGATSPEDYGDYFSWGETTTKEIYEYSDSPTYWLTNSELQTKGYIDSEGNLTSQYDAATANWGGNWRMPTYDEFEELIDKCTWTLATHIQSDVNGYIVEGPNGNSIFLPAAGSSFDAFYDACGRYWSSKPFEDNSYDVYDAYILSFISRNNNDNNDHYISSYARGYGSTVRPVLEENNVSSSTTSSTIVQQKHNGYEYVDLGLSVKWATCNVGADSPEAYGDYFAWGETRAKSLYSEVNSKTTDKTMNDISANPQYDAARANWGGNWRMPTYAELEELETKCTWTWTTQNGVNGYKVIGPNGNNIFLPAAGVRSGSSLCFDGSVGYYRSSLPYCEDYDFYAYSLILSANRIMGYEYRYEGESVRPVLEENKTSSSITDQQKHNGYEYVDLGLSVKWATCNVGADSPEKYGDCFAWGETTTKAEYCSTEGISKSELQSRGYIDSEGNLTSQYDAATANWGGAWRMPTNVEMYELINDCIWTRTTQNNVSGYKVTGPNGNSIFIPCVYESHDVCYWSSTPRNTDGWYGEGAYFLDLFHEPDLGGYHGRCCGYSVRPVLE